MVLVSLGVVSIERGVGVWSVERGVVSVERGVGVVTRVRWYKAEILLVWAKRRTCWAEAGLGCMGTLAWREMSMSLYVNVIVNNE